MSSSLAGNVSVEKSFFKYGTFHGAPPSVFFVAMRGTCSFPTINNDYSHHSPRTTMTRVTVTDDDRHLPNNAPRS